MGPRARRASPGEYLQLLESAPAVSYRSLLDEHQGNLALAAHELATIRLAARGVGLAVPCARELWVAALEIAARTGSIEPPPPADVLARDARAQGLAVT